MIRKGQDFSGAEDVIVAEFGAGSIDMYIGTSLEKVSLVFKNSGTTRPIGVPMKHNIKSFRELQPDLAFTFSNIKSIDSVISMLTLCKEEWKKKLEESDEDEAS